MGVMTTKERFIKRAQDGELWAIFVGDLQLVFAEGTLDQTEAIPHRDALVVAGMLRIGGFRLVYDTAGIYRVVRGSR